MQPSKPYLVGASHSATAEDASPAMLVLKFRDGRSTALSYGYLHRIDFDGADTIRLHFVTNTVTLRGRNLASVVDGLHRQAEGCITETDQLHVASDEMPRVTQIDVLMLTFSEQEG